MMVDVIWMGIIFVSALGMGLAGMGLYSLLPVSIRERIEKIDE